MIFLTRNQFMLFLVLTLQTAFTIAQDGNTPPVVMDGVSVPSDFPQFIPGVNLETAPGDIFITNSEGSPYLLILKNDGSPYFYRRLKDHSLDFRPQPTGQYTRWIDEDVRGYELMDEYFQALDTLKCQNGFETDQHELQVLPNGHALMIAREEKPMSQVDPAGDPKSTVIGNHIQEIDANGTVVFQWMCWDHFNLEDSYINYQAAYVVDYIHMNSIAVDYDGNLVISSRHLSECTKISRQSGEIIWRLGGKNNQFEFINDTLMFSSQHDIRPVPGKPNHYTLFDNGNTRDPKFSRALEFKLDTLNMQAEKVWEYRHTPDRYSRLMGSVQRLTNGNTLINWGDPALPKITEVSPEGSLVFEADFIPVMNNYRTYRFECNDMVLAPYLVAEPYPDRLRLLFNKFGDKGVAYFNIYGGTNAQELHWIDSTSLPWMDLMDLEASAYHYVEVTSVDSSGHESPPSKQEKVYVRNSRPGDNLILNGEFAVDASFWTHENDRDGSSYGSVADSIYRFNITNAGQVSTDVQLYQTDIPMLYGHEYILELDARADSPRMVEIEVERAGIPWISYSKHGQSYITEQFTRIEHTFTMDQVNDLDARFVIKGGGTEVDFEVKNISLRQVVPTGLRLKEKEVSGLQIYPNPVSGELHISYHLEGSSPLQIQLFSLSGQLLQTFYQGKQEPGKCEHSLDMQGFAEGAYMLLLRTDSSATSSMVLVEH